MQHNNGIPSLAELEASNNGIPSLAELEGKPLKKKVGDFSPQAEQVKFALEEPQTLSPEDKTAYDEGMATVTASKAIQPFTSDITAGFVPDVKKGYIFEAGYNQSLIGLTDQIINGEARFDVQEHDPSILEEIAAIAVGFTIDAPFFILSGGVGGVATKAALQQSAKVVIKEAGKQTVKKFVKKGMTQEGAEHLVKRGMAKNAEIIAKISGKAQAVGSSATALGAYGATHEALRQMAEEEKSFDELEWDKVSKEGFISGALGAMLGVAGLGGKATEKLIRGSAMKAPAKIGALTGAKTAEVGAEVSIFAIGDKALRGESILDLTSTDWANAAKMVAGAKISGLAQKGIKFIKDKSFEKENEGKFRVDFTPEELRLLNKGENTAEVINNTKEQSGVVLADILANENIPLTAKQKLLWATRGVRPDIMPEIRQVELETRDDKSVLVTRNSKGMLLDVKEYTNPEQANKDALSLIEGVKEIERKEKTYNLTFEQQLKVREKITDVDFDQLDNALNIVAGSRTKEDKALIKEFDATVDEVVKETKLAPSEQPLTKTTYDFESAKPENLEKFEYYTKDVEGETKYFKKEKAEEVEKPKSILTQETDLKGEKKEAWMRTKEQDDVFSPVPEIGNKYELLDGTAVEIIKKETEIGLPGAIWSIRYEDGKIEKATTPRINELVFGDITTHLGRINKALSGNQYQQAISEGRMTANDAKTIIENAKLEVPKDILEMAEKEIAPKELPTGKPAEAKKEEPEIVEPEKELPEFKEHITTGTKEQKGKYQVEKVGDEVKILNVDSGKYVKPTKQNQWVIDQYVDANIENFRAGKEAEIPEGINPAEVNDFVAENSKNPAEVATAWIGSKETKDVGAITFEEAVYEVARDIDPVDFAKTVGYGPKNVPHLLSRFKKGGVSLDVIRERAAEQLELSEEQAEYFEKQPTKEAEPIQRIVDLLTSPKFKDYKPKKETITEINLAEKFKQLTGLDLTVETAKKVTDYRDKLEKWADKIDEFIEEIPEVGLPFFMAPRLLKFALQTVSKALRAGSDLRRAIKLAIIKTKEIMKADEKFDEKEFRKLIREKGQAAMLGMKERKFAKRIEAAKGLSEEIRKGLSDEGKYYVPITNRITKEEAQIIINEKGVDLALSDVINENNVLSPAVRITLGETLIHEYNKLAIEGKDVKKQYAKAVEVAEFLTQYGTKLGQGIQAFHIWSELSPESVILKVKKDLKKQGVELTPEQEKEIRELTKKVEKAKEGLSKSRAIQDLLKYQMKIEGVKWGDVPMSVWYSNVLSGYTTQQLNFGANMTQTVGKLYTSIIYNPKATPFLLKGLYEGYGRGLFEAWGTLKTGYTPINQIKYETGKEGQPDVLESFKFKGGAWNPLNYYKYVRRFMMATDAFSFYGLKEMRDYELAYREAKKFEDPDKTTWDKVNQLLYKDQISEAKKQAKKEGLSGTEYKQRVYEITEQKRAVELTEDSNNFAAHGTFNYNLEGSLGLLTSRIAEAIETINYKGIKPFKFVVPFTRIISNVTNEYLDWSVWGYVRAARGKRGLLTGESERFTRELTKEERIKNIIKATTGTAAMLTIYALTDEDDGTFEITANGTGDYRKNYELKEQGWQPYSIRIGKKWYSYINTPLAIPFAFIGNIRDNAKYKDNFLDGEDVLTKTLITAYNTSKFVTDMTFLRGFSEFVGSFSEKNPELAASYFERFGTQVIKGFVVPNIVTQVSRKMQETFEMPIKQADNLWEQIIRDMPIARKGLKDVINTLGDPVIPNTDRWVRDAEFDPIWDVIIKNNAWIGKVNKGTISIYDPEKDMMRPITADEYYDFSKLRGQLIKQAITINLSKLQTMDKEAVKNTITVYKSRATIDAKDKLFAPKSKKAKSIYGSPNSGYYQDE